MSEVFIYLDETGTLDYDNVDEPYFGFGSARFEEGHDAALAAVTRLRLELASRHGTMLNGFHAKDDSWATRAEMFALIGEQELEMRSTLFYKPNAFGYVRRRGALWLYKYAIFCHLRNVLAHATSPGDRVYIIAAHIDMRAKREQIRAALEDVRNQMPNNREVHLVVWKSPTSAGLQIADYGLWARHRLIRGGALREPVREAMRRVFKYWPDPADEFPWKVAPNH